MKLCDNSVSLQMANTERYAIYDIETLSNLMTFCFMDYATKKRREFVIHESRNDFEGLYKFLREMAANQYYLVGFNNLAFDSQVVQFALGAYEHLKNLPPERIAYYMYMKAQEVLNVPEKERYTILVPEHRLSVMQIDLYKQKHYDGKAKRTSLKWLEFTMNFHNIEEMPIEHTEHIKAEQIPSILSYNWNDVEATHDFFKLMKFETELRLKLSEKFGLPLLNASEPRMAREILAKLLAEDMGITVKELKEKRTFRKEIHLGKCIIPIIKFEEDCFKELVAKLKKTTINATKTKGCFEHSINYKGIDIDYGVGGVHGAVPAGVYKSDADYVIKTVDVVSFYPRMIINYGFAPAHLGDTFSSRYDWFFTERRKYDKKDPINYIYKIILNSTYGLSNDMNSFLYDTMTTMKTTINGQLLLTMLAEQLSGIPDSKLLMMNTDGLEIKIPRTAEEDFTKLCKAWERYTGLELEYDEYERIVLGDVNNYIGVFSKRTAKSEEAYNKLKEDEKFYLYNDSSLSYNPVKLKGRFELKLDYHKNPSGIIISKGVYNYFVKGISPEESIMAANNIFDFCYGVKRKYDFNLVLHSVNCGEHITEKQQKVTRYYVSTNGGRLVKEYHNGRKISVNASALVTPCNRIDNPELIPYNLDKQFYINECYKEIHGIEGSKSNQLSLF